MLRRLVDWIRPPPIRSARDLEVVTEREAARLTTKCTIMYCRVKASANAKKLFGEEPFRIGLENCRWEAYAAILADALRVVEANLRPAAADRAEMLDAPLLDFYARSLAVRPRPNGGDWAEAVDALRVSLARGRLAPPRPAYDFGNDAGNLIYDLLPIHKSLRREDREVIVNQIRFGLVTLQQELERRADVARLLADYLEAADRR